MRRAGRIPKRRAYRTVLDTLFHALVRWPAPVLVFTAEEVWGTRYPDAGSVHLLEWPDLGTLLYPGASSNPPETGPRVRGDTDLMERWTSIRSTRVQVNEAIEPLRREKIVRSSLEAQVVMPQVADLTPKAMAEIAITAAVTYGGEGVIITPTTDHKCGRCWRHLPEVATDGTLCNRCETVLEAE